VATFYDDKLSNILNLDSNEKNVIQLAAVSCKWVIDLNMGESDKALISPLIGFVNDMYFYLQRW
jgi:hypothetical protein